MWFFSYLKSPSQYDDVEHYAEHMPEHMLEHMPEHLTDHCVDHCTNDSAIDPVDHNQITHQITYQITMKNLTVLRYDEHLESKIYANLYFLIKFRKLSTGQIKISLLHPHSAPNDAPQCAPVCAPTCAPHRGSARQRRHQTSRVPSLLAMRRNRPT